jgi:hypothetical protein
LIVGDPHGEAARRLCEEVREELRAALRATVRKALQRQAAEKGVPPEEAVTSELVEEIALEVCLRLAENSVAVIDEFVTEEDLGRIYEEEEARLSPEYPGEEVPEEVLTAAMVERLEMEKPQAFKPGRRRRP